MMFSSYCLTICLTLLRGVGTGRLLTGLSCFRSNLISSDLLSFFKLALSIYLSLDFISDFIVIL